jgi:hypothetical protein
MQPPLQQLYDPVGPPQALLPSHRVPKESQRQVAVRTPLQPRPARHASPAAGNDGSVAVYRMTGMQSASVQLDITNV